MTKSGEEKPATEDALITSQFVCEVSQNGRLVRSNPAWQQLLNSISPQAMIHAGDPPGERFLDWVHPEDRSAVREVFEQLEAGSQEMTSEFRLRGDCAERIIILHWTCWLAAKDVAGKDVAAKDQVSWIGTGRLSHASGESSCQNAWASREMQDDAAPWSATRQREGNYNLGSAELAAFASRASHDIRAPLRAIHGLSQILCEDYANSIDDSGRDYLKRVATAARRLGITVDGVTEYLRLAGYGASFRTVNLNEMMLEVAAEYRASDSDVCGKVVSECLPEVHGDPVQLLRLFHELVSNGIVHNSSNEPEVQVAVYQEEDRSEHAVGPNRVVICVSDNGGGVQEQHREEIFAAFRRLNPTGNANGVGLGLATATRIVQRHGGGLRCLGDKSEGCRFVFDLPLVREHSETVSERTN